MLLKKKKAVLLANLKKRNLEDICWTTQAWTKYWTKNISAVMEEKKQFED
jgi:hypothetical protein